MTKRQISSVQYQADLQSNPETWKVATLQGSYDLRSMQIVVTWDGVA